MDFGRIVAGFVNLILRPRRARSWRCTIGRRCFPPGTGWSGEDPETGARYLAAGTDDQFAALEINGLRYLTSSSMQTSQSR